MVARRKDRTKDIWLQDRPTLEEVRAGHDAEAARAFLQKNPANWPAEDVRKLLADIRCWRGHDDPLPE